MHKTHALAQHAARRQGAKRSTPETEANPTAMAEQFARLFAVVHQVARAAEALPEPMALKEDARKGANRHAGIAHDSVARAASQIVGGDRAQTRRQLAISS